MRGICSLISRASDTKTAITGKAGLFSSSRIPKTSGTLSSMNTWIAAIFRSNRRI
ncbi:hypothetical protein [Paenibacillus harenae]|uniref:hypothetical protein n=1 Tax=Paenibacillus harenae TaxID=306543 RepID=UPI0027D92B7F|nr:hypothetical protein [Paenibacillus harenae]